MTLENEHEVKSFVKSIFMLEEPCDEDRAIKIEVTNKKLVTSSLDAINSFRLLKNRRIPTTIRSETTMFSIHIGHGIRNATAKNKI